MIFLKASLIAAALAEANQFAIDSFWISDPSNLAGRTSGQYQAGAGQCSYRIGNYEIAEKTDWINPIANSRRLLAVRSPQVPPWSTFSRVSVVNCTRRLFSLTVTALAITFATNGTAFASQILYESGTLGPTGVPASDLGGPVPGTNISTFAYSGVKFQLSQHVLAEQVGGHFVARTSGTFFGAIVKLDGPDDFPNSGNLSTPDVIGTALLAFPQASGEVYGDISLSLNSGWYALVFGSGLFGATTNGGAVRNGLDIGDPTYIGFQPGFSSRWSVLTSLFDNHRFVVRGTAVPEPCTWVLILGCAPIVSRRHSASC